MHECSPALHSARSVSRPSRPHSQPCGRVICARISTLQAPSAAITCTGTPTTSWPEWRNWQTRRIQNPVRVKPRVGSSPTFGIGSFCTIAHHREPCCKHPFLTGVFAFLAFECSPLCACPITLAVPDSALPLFRAFDPLTSFKILGFFRELSHTDRRWGQGPPLHPSDNTLATSLWDAKPTLDEWIITPFYGSRTQNILPTLLKACGP